MHLAWGMAQETSHACIAGSGTCYNLDIEWRAAELLLSLPNTQEDIFSGHLLSHIFQSTLHITITSLCLGVDTVRFSCLLLCAQNLIYGGNTTSMQSSQKPISASISHTPEKTAD